MKTYRCDVCHVERSDKTLWADGDHGKWNTLDLIDKPADKHVGPQYRSYDLCQGCTQRAFDMVQDLRRVYRGEPQDS